ncbi:hypothetical protein LCGC14_0245800 [marine sediment metagenome]|uniref:Uncharacterized protein n=1 Tax=marine sediment metagenome TaxID=412755 RepID=A0A0F9UAK3_9ZZZZ
MCEILEDFTESKNFTGYKVARKEKGKYYSLTTGIEYREGRTMPKLRQKLVRADVERWPWNLLESGSTFYSPGMQGRTGVFVHKPTVHLIQSPDTAVLLKMTITGGLKRGRYIGSVLLIAGRKIVKFKEVKFATI